VIRISLDEPTLARTRITISPLMEAVASLYLLARNPGKVPWPYDTWARRARTVLAELPQAAPLRLYAESDPWTPDIFAPFPRVPSPSLAQELAELRATPRALVDEQFGVYFPDRVPDWAKPYQHDPAGAFGRLADAIGAYWKAAIAPYWPAMGAALDEEVLHRARALAAEGADALLADLHDRIRWEKPVLTLVKPPEYSFTTVNQRLLLVPLIFSRGALMCSTDDPDVVAVSYQARGAVLLADDPPDRAAAQTDRLAILVGRGRAAVLRALTRPATTAGLAATLALAPSTVSEHLSVLVSAGVVNRRRVGRRVLYGLEPAGLALVTLIGADLPAVPSASG
jgi:DNA-binding transcriptional ArsR family regulator